MRRLALFDLDGTLTKKDTLVEFIKYIRGKEYFYLGALLFLPVMLVMKLRLISDNRSKEILLKIFIGNMKTETLLAKGETFSIEILPKLVTYSAKRQLDYHTENGDDVVIVSASTTVWIQKWCDINNYLLISTKLKFSGGKFSGRFDGKNCKGEEKVMRIKQELNLSDYDYIFAYGNDKSDIPMLNLADKSYYGTIDEDILN